MIVTPVFVPPPPSARAKRLAGEIEQTIAGFRRKEPGTGDSEVRRALQLAGRRTAGGSDQMVVVIVAVVLVLAGLLVFFKQSGIGAGPDGAGFPPWTMQAVVAVILVVLAVVYKRHR